jgi:circadian clock protein KaiC
MTDHGITLLDVVVGSRGILTGSARVRQIAETDAADAERSADLERRQRAFERRAAEVEAEIALLRERLASQRTELDGLAAETLRGEPARTAVRTSVALQREPGPESDREKRRGA